MRPNYFVAFPISKAEELIPGDAPDVLRLFHPDDLHCTLAFLGAMQAERSEAIVKIIKQIQSPPLRLISDRLRMLPSAESFSALSWVFSEGAAQVEALMTKYRMRCFEAAHAKEESRPALAHCTVARPRGRLNSMQREALTQWMAHCTSTKLAVEINSVALYTWADDRTMRQFKIVEEFPLTDKV